MEARAADGTAGAPKDSFCLEPIDKTLLCLKWRPPEPKFLLALVEEVADPSSWPSY